MQGNAYFPLVVSPSTKYTKFLGYFYPYVRIHRHFNSLAYSAILVCKKRVIQMCSYYSILNLNDSLNLRSLFCFVL